MSFEKAARWILAAEGGYVHDPADPGGATRYGISQRAYPHLDIQALTPEGATEIYRRDYWQATHCDALPEPVGLIVFDAAVNQGAGTAVRLLQTCVGVEPDGQVGPKTLAAVGAQPAMGLARQLLARRAVAYQKIPEGGRFIRGWMNRLFHLQSFVLTGEL